MRGADFVDRIIQHAEKQDERWMPHKMEVSSRSSGLVVVREPVTAEVIEQPYAFVKGLQYETGDDVLMIPCGGGEFVAVPIGKAALTLLKPDAPQVGQVYMYGRDANNAETLSTGNTATYVDGLTLSWATGGSFPIPDGTYTVMVTGSAILAGSTGNNIDLRLTVGGVDGTGVTVAVPTGTLPGPGNRGMTMETMAGVVVSGGLTIVLKYKGVSGGAGGTAYMRNPAIQAFATRTA